MKRYEVSSLMFSVQLQGLDTDRPKAWIGTKLCKLPGVPNPVERFCMTRPELADLLRGNRRTNLGTDAKRSGDFGIMKQCARTTLSEWKTRH